MFDVNHVSRTENKKKTRKTKKNNAHNNKHWQYGCRLIVFQIKTRKRKLILFWKNKDYCLLTSPFPFPFPFSSPCLLDKFPLYSFLADRQPP